MSARPAILVLTRGGAALASRLKDVLPEAEIHGLARRVADADVLFEDSADHLRALFEAGRPIVGICAAGILIRALAPLLADKRAEPPVLAVAEDGGVVVPLLGGHHGANALAAKLAEALGCEAAITTAGDRRLGVALDDPPPGWRLGTPEHVKAFTARLLAEGRARLRGAAPWLETARIDFAEDAALTFRVAENCVAGSETTLVYHPTVLALGVGCERGTAPDELLALVRATLAEHGLAAAAVAGVFSLDLKSDEPAMAALAQALDVPFRVFDAATLEAEATRLANPSELVFREVGCHGVAEGAALAAAGPTGQLLVPKVKSARATCAIALAPGPLDATTVGRARGRLSVIGLGPGGASWRTGEAAALLRQVTDLVGYKLYLDLAGPLTPRQQRHDFALGEEEARVRHALDLAAEGRDVALVCSGDPGIYAMASLVFELLERGGRTDWRRVAVTVAPGISALQAAAARIGAPLGHDFCAISLSDLLTPWPAIERRLKAAAEGDFVVALYNPVSRRRRRQLGDAVAILRQDRPAETPVVLARNLGRADESVSVLRLDEVTPEAVDMLTLVLIGSSATRRLARGDGGLWVYTPRGYGDKQGRSSEDAA